MPRTKRQKEKGRVSDQVLLQLKRWNTPTIYNGWKRPDAPSKKPRAATSGAGRQVHDNGNKGLNSLRRRAGGREALWTAAAMLPLSIAEP